jgi:hypothetical protein
MLTNPVPILKICYLITKTNRNMQSLAYCSLTQKVLRDIRGCGGHGIGPPWLIHLPGNFSSRVPEMYNLKFIKC